jgi:hypothetical protein
MGLSPLDPEIGTGPPVEATIPTDSLPVFSAEYHQMNVLANVGHSDEILRPALIDMKQRELICARKSAAG